MRAFVNGPDGPELADVPDPDPRPDEALVAVQAFSINRGELRLLDRRPAGWRPGQDIAGVVLAPAADGSGPPEGTRIAALVEQEGWAERAAVPTARLAVLPEGVDVVRGAALPMAAHTALRTLRLGGDLLGQRVLVTGASGGVGRFHVELAALAGAHVTAVARPEHGADLKTLGAEAVVPSTDAAEGPFELILESAGGASLTAALGLIAPRGTIVLFGNSSREPAELDFSRFFGHEGARLQLFHSYGDTTPIGPDLQLLVDLVAADRLHPTVGLERDWTELQEALTALRRRQVVGKVVLTVG